MSWIAVGSAAVTVVGGAIANNQQKKAAQGASNAAAAGSAAEIAERQRQFDLTRADNEPFLRAGQNALGGLEKLSNGDFSGFNQSPDFLFAQQQGTQGLDRSAAARGGLLSGGHTADTLSFNQGLASQQLGNFRNSLQSLAGLGQNTGIGLGQFGANLANGNANSIGNATNARMSSFQRRGDANSQFATGAFGAINNGFNQFMAQRGGG